MQYLNLLGTALGVFFILNGIYGITAGKVFGRSWEKYWGGFIYKTQNPVYYWSYVFMWLFVGTVLLATCARGW